MSQLKKVLCAAALVALVAVPASAATITFVDLGTAAPPATLGGKPMLAFPDDPRPNGSSVSSVPVPGVPGGSVAFSGSMSLFSIGAGWATWSHGYTGDVYYSQGATSRTLTLPALTDAFYFYLEPNPFQSITFTVTATGGGVSTFTVDSIEGFAGAEGFGFYSHDTSIASISISGGSDFAVGEFGIHQAPEPASMLLLGGGLAALAARRRRARK